MKNVDDFCEYHQNMIKNAFQNIWDGKFSFFHNNFKYNWAFQKVEHQSVSTRYWDPKSIEWALSFGIFWVFFSLMQRISRIPKVDFWNCWPTIKILVPVESIRRSGLACGLGQSLWLLTCRPYEFCSPQKLEIIRAPKIQIERYRGAGRVISQVWAPWKELGWSQWTLYVENRHAPEHY